MEIIDLTTHFIYRRKIQDLATLRAPGLNKVTSQDGGAVSSVTCHPSLTTNNDSNLKTLTLDHQALRIN